MNFSVLYDPVIPVIMLDGENRELGIREALEKAHQIRGIQCSSPLEKYAMIRLLVAFSMDILQPKRWSDRQELLEKGQFNPETLDSYFSMCEKDGPRFELFDKEHPFMQAKYDEKLDGKALKAISNISVSLPSGNNHIFLNHRPEDVSVMTPAEAFRALIAIYVFCTAGAQGYPSGINNTPPLYAWVAGRNLYEEIILNSVAEKECAPIKYGAGEVPWRSNEPIIPKQMYEEVTMLEALTWQPRRATLVRDEDGMVRRVYFQQGKNFKGNAVWQDPHVAYRYTKSGEWFSVKPQSGRALWRDIGSMLMDASAMKAKPPLVVAQAARVLDNEDVLLNINEVGLVTNQASYVEWLEEHLSIPAAFMEEEGMANLLRSDVEGVERIQSAIVSAVNKKIKNGAALSEQARSHFLNQMHDIVFGYSIPSLLNIRCEMTEEKQLEHIIEFNRKMLKALHNTFREVVENSGAGSGYMLAQVEAHSYAVNLFMNYKIEREGEHE